ncbi:MAG: hypothetical protein ABIS50_13360 [Luteolibacter sp.]|uniref:hypothetical protein n=1 Tax=Luteolibacter sp. TaxID=1962973 RepID=UPI003265BD6B
MNLRFSAAFAALGCVLLASCYPYNENQNKKQTEKPAQKTVSSADQQKLQAQRDQLKAQEELQKKNDLVEKKPSETSGTTAGTTIETTKPPVEEKRTDYAFANKVPGKEGFVFSPYNNKIVDVRDIPSGTLVQDPTYTGAGKGYFRVP